MSCDCFFCRFGTFLTDIQGVLTSPLPMEVRDARTASSRNRKSWKRYLEGPKCVAFCTPKRERFLTTWTLFDPHLRLLHGHPKNKQFGCLELGRKATSILQCLYNMLGESYIVYSFSFLHGKDSANLRDLCDWNPIIQSSCELHLFSVISAYHLIKGSLEVKLPTIWRVEKQSRDEKQRREVESEERRDNCAKLSRKKIETRKMLGK